MDALAQGVAAVDALAAVDVDELEPAALSEFVVGVNLLVDRLTGVSHRAVAANVFSIGSPRGGSFEDPEFLYTITEPGVGVGGNWHSAALTWDGEVIILG
ncbi:MAG: hypothetical protein GEU81_16390 [Nitriliruptorales bacterium]|nr:hypothetical protein [Nitriliruptorales bacterium]